jgi:hypothetical protein
LKENPSLALIARHAHKEIKKLFIPQHYNEMTEDDKEKKEVR